MKRKHAKEVYPGLILGGILDIDDMLEKKAAREAEKALLDKERKRAYNKKKK